MWRAGGATFTVMGMRAKPASIAAVAALPLLATATAVTGSVRALRRIGSSPFSEPELPGERGTVTLPSGTVVSFRYRTTGEGTPLVFLHGWGSCADASWFSVLPLLTAPFLAIDHPGHGGSAGASEFSFDLAADGLLAAVTTLGLRGAHLVAHSMGGGVALTALRTDPEAFSRVTMVATTAFFSSPAMSALVALAPRFASSRSPLLVRGLLREMEELPAHAYSIAWAWRNRPTEAVLTSSAAALRSFDARDWGDVTCPPTRWVVPEEDRVIRPALQLMSAGHFDHDVLSLADAGHSFFLHHPERLLFALELP
jgi:pimeloyl-ACP methyl ester carboxylesterase